MAKLQHVGSVHHVTTVDRWAGTPSVQPFVQLTVTFDVQMANIFHCALARAVPAVRAVAAAVAVTANKHVELSVCPFLPTISVGNKKKRSFTKPLVLSSRLLSTVY